MNIRIILLTMLLLVSCSKNSNVNSVSTMEDLDSDVIVQKLEFGSVSITELPDFSDAENTIITYRIQNISGINGRIKVKHNSELSYISSTCGNNTPKTLKTNSSCDFKLIIPKKTNSGNYPITVSVDDVSSSLIIGSYFKNYYHSSVDNFGADQNNVSCKTGFHFESRICRSDIKAMPSSVLTQNNALSGYQIWNSLNSTYSNVLTACLPNYALSNNICELVSISCASGEIAIGSVCVNSLLSIQNTNEYINTTQFSLIGTCSDTLLLSFSENGNSSNTDINCNNGNYVKQYNITPGADGDRVISVSETDQYGNSHTVSKTFIYDTIDPTLSINTVSTIDATNQNNYLISGNCSEVGQQVDILVDTIYSSTMCQIGGHWSTYMDVSDIPDSGNISFSIEHSDLATNSTLINGTLSKNTMIDTYYFLKSDELISDVFIGGNNNCLKTNSGSYYCWGNNTNYQFGDMTAIMASIPIKINYKGSLSGKNIIQLAVGNTHACALDSDNLAHCWGAGTNGALGQGLNNTSVRPVSVNMNTALSGKTIKKLFLGKSSTTCAIASDDLAYCWGAGTSGQLGNGVNSNSNIPVAVSTSGVLSGKTIKDITIGASHICVIASDDLPYCWGVGGNGQLGNGLTSNSNIPVAVSTSGVLSGKTIKTITAGTSHTCVIASDDLPYCWGGGTIGQLGNGLTSNSNIPVAVSTSGVLSGKTIKKIVVGGTHTCAIGNDNLLYCWGAGTTGQLGNGINSNSNIPVAVSTSGVLSGKSISQVVAGTNHTCALSMDSQLYCWGQNNDGQLGKGDTIASLFPTNILPPMPFITQNKMIKDMAINSNNACILFTDNSIICNGSGNLGDGLSTLAYNGVYVKNNGVLFGKNIDKIYSNNINTYCVIDSNSQTYCWGAGTSGQLGDGSNIDKNEPVAVAGPFYAKQLAMGQTFTCGIDLSNRLYCWGGMSFNGSTDSNTPVIINTPTPTIKKISASGPAHICIIGTDDKVYCAGNNMYGQLGNGTTTETLDWSPVSTAGILNNKNIIDIATGPSHSCAITSDNLLSCWGSNTNGALGDGTTTHSLVPVSSIMNNQIGSNTYQKVLIAGNTTCVQVNNQISCWGGNTNGLIAIGSNSPTVNNPNPINISYSYSYDFNITSVSKMFMGGTGTLNTLCIMSNDNRGYCSGNNQNNKLLRHRTTTTVPYMLPLFIPNN